MRIALLTTDGREVRKDYHTPAPHFGTAPEALMQGLALLPEVEVHVLACVRARVMRRRSSRPTYSFTASTFQGLDG